MRKLLSVKYRLSDAISVYKDDESVDVVKGHSGEVCSFKNTSDFLSLLQLLQNPQTRDDIYAYFPNRNSKSIAYVLDILIEQGIVEPLCDEFRVVHVLLIGVGSLGSHIYQHLSMLPLDSITIVDSDAVETSNLFRQNYYPADSGREKIDVLAARPSRISQINTVYNEIRSSDEIIALIEKFHCNLIIQAADKPSSGKMSEMICEAALAKSVAYIINPGYLGGAVVFPEFYYPDSSYNYLSMHHSWRKDFVFQHQNEKIPFRICSEIGSLIAQQVQDYRMFKQPVGYQRKGYFDSNEYRWVTVSVNNKKNGER